MVLKKHNIAIDLADHKYTYCYTAVDWVTYLEPVRKPLIQVKDVVYSLQVVQLIQGLWFI